MNPISDPEFDKQLERSLKNNPNIIGILTENLRKNYQKEQRESMFNDKRDLFLKSF